MKHESYTGISIMNIMSLKTYELRFPTSRVEQFQDQGEPQPQEDIRCYVLVREKIGPQRRLMIDANQVCEVDEAIQWVQALAQCNPWWIEEPLSPDDILGHRRVAQAVRPIRVATGERAHNRVLFKTVYRQQRNRRSTTRRASLRRA